MAKKSGIDISGIAVIRTIVFLLIAFICFTVYTRTVNFLTTSPIFEVKNVLVDVSIQFIDMRVLKSLKGRNIFKVDIQKVHRQIAAEYPQIAQLRVVRQLPDRIKVLAKKREALAQIALKSKYLVIDTEGVSLYYNTPPVALPVISGVAFQKGNVVLGAPVVAKNLDVAMMILTAFKRPVLRGLKIASLSVDNPSKIDITLSDGVHVIIDQDQSMHKIDILEMLIVQHKVDFAQVKYIDVRFQEPLIAEHPDKTTKKE